VSGRDDGNCRRRVRGQGDEPEVHGNRGGHPGEQPAVPPSGLQQVAQHGIRSTHARESTSLPGGRAPLSTGPRNDQAALLLLDDPPDEDDPPEDELPDEEPPDEEPPEDEPPEEDDESEEEEEEAASLLAGTVLVPAERLSVR
jgi:hypothetical protein